MPIQSLIPFLAGAVLAYFLPGYFHDLFKHGFRVVPSALLVLLIGWGVYVVFTVGGKVRRRASEEAEGKMERQKRSAYGLQHGRLHVGFPVAMWMNMGFWSRDEGSHVSGDKSMAEACRDLLREVLFTAGFSASDRDRDFDDFSQATTTRRIKCLIDLGFGCGDQTIALMSRSPVSRSDDEWWDGWGANVGFERYVGITIDKKQYQFAEERVQDMRKKVAKEHQPSSNKSIGDSTTGTTSTQLFCGDAANPATWDPELTNSIEKAINNTQDHWVLALDTAYHFSPSRWPLIHHVSHTLNASFMAFDLCISPTATRTQTLLLRLLTALMGAPWTNFVTPDEYHAKLVEAGYHDSNIVVRDVSEHVFEPLVRFLEQQDRRLKGLGMGIGRFGVAKKMFGWWGKCGVVRGCIVVARKGKEEM